MTFSDFAFKLAVVSDKIAQLNNKLDKYAAQIPADIAAPEPPRAIKVIFICKGGFFMSTVDWLQCSKYMME